MEIRVLRADLKRLYLYSRFVLWFQDYDAALSVYEILLEKDKEHRYSLLCGLGRIHLQVILIVFTDYLL